MSSESDLRWLVRVMPSRSRRSGGEDEGYDTFFRIAFPRAVAVALRITGDRSAAEDAALEALAKAHFRWTRVAGLERPDLWVIKVAAREAIRRLPKPGQAAADASPCQADELDPAEAVALRQTLAQALATLPRRQCEVVVLRYLVGLSETEVAQALDIRHGTVKTHLRRGLSALRQSVGGNLKEEHLARLA
jgi:RNA polymerase sigma-70 factor (sigma-E family)